MPTLDPFDPMRPLVAATFIRLHAIIYRKGDAIPYADEDHRILNRLYEQRKITYGDGVPVVATSPNEAFRQGQATRRQQEKAGTAEAELAAQMAAEPTDEEAAAAKALMSNTHDALFQMASGLAGVTKKQTKGEIALALVRAGRGPA